MILVLCMIFASACAVQPVKMPIAEPAEELDEDAITRAYVEKAVAYFEEHGLEKTIAFYSSGESVDGERYLMLMDPKTFIVHASPIAFLVGAELPMFQPGGQYAGQAARATAAGHWIEYLWPHPVTLKEVPKLGYAVRHDGMIFASGYYPAPSVAELRAATVAYIQQAIEFYDREGLDATVAHYNSRESISDNDIYLRLLDADNIVIVQPLQPQLIGKDYVAVAKTPQGVPVGELVVAAATEEGGWVQFEAQLPNTRASGFSQRYLLAVRHDNLIFVASFSASE